MQTMNWRAVIAALLINTALLTAMAAASSQARVPTSRAAASAQDPSAAYDQAPAPTTICATSIPADNG